MARQPLSHFEDDQIDLRQILLTLARNWWIIALVFLIAVMGMASYSMTRPSVYEARTSLLVVAPVSGRLAEDARPEGDIQRISVPAGADLSNQALQALAVSGDILESVIRELDLTTVNNEALLPVFALERMISVSVVRADRDTEGVSLPLLTMTVRGQDPAQVQAIANKWAEVFIRENGELFVSEAARSHDFLGRQVEAVQLDLAQAQEARLGHLRQHPLDRLQARAGVLESRYQASLSQLLQKEAELVQQRQRVDSLDEALSRESGVLVFQRSIPYDSLLPWLGGGPSAGQLGALESIRLVDEEPNQVYLGLREQLRNAEVQVGTLTAEVEDLRARVGEMDAELLGLSQRIAEARVVEEDFQRDVQILSSHLRDLSSRLQVARLARAREGNVIRVVQRAIEPAGPVLTGLTRNVMLAGVLGLMAGVGFVFVREVLRWPEGGRNRNRTKKVMTSRLPLSLRGVKTRCYGAVSHHLSGVGLWGISA